MAKFGSIDGNNDLTTEVAVKISHNENNSELKLLSASSFFKRVILNFLHHPNINQIFGTCHNYQNENENTISTLVNS